MRTISRGNRKGNLLESILRWAFTAGISAAAFGQSNLTQVGVSFQIPVVAYGCCQQIVGHSTGQGALAPTGVPFGQIQTLDFSGGQYSDTGTLGSWTLIVTLQNTDLLIFSPAGSA